MAIQSTTMKYGAPHITSAQMGSFNAGIFGTGAYVLNTRNKFALTVNSANSITIGTGDAVCNGRHFVLESPETLSVDSGTQSLKRKDLVCLRYTKSGDVETPSIVVIKGTASADPVDPQHNTGSIIDGATIVDFPLYRLNINGINFEGYDTIMSTPLIGGADVIVAEGTSGNWFYVKYESGLAFAVYTATEQYVDPSTKQWVAGYPTYAMLASDFPFPFDFKSLLALIPCGTDGNAYYAVNKSATSNQYGAPIGIGSLYIWYPNMPGSNFSANWSVIAIGTWK